MMKPEIFAKHAKKVTKNAAYIAKGKPGLKYISADKNNLYANDSHRLYRFKNTNLNDGLYDTNLNQITEDISYPSNLISFFENHSNNEEISSVTLSNATVIELIKHLKVLRKNGSNTNLKHYKKQKNVVIRLSSKNGFLIVENIHSNECLSFNVGVVNQIREFSIMINATYLIDVLEFVNYSTNTETNIEVIDPFSPVLFNANRGNVAAIVLPVRKLMGI